MAKCNRKTEVYSRVVGYHRPIRNWNPGKQEEFRQRKASSAGSAVHKAVKQNCKEQDNDRIKD